MGSRSKEKGRRGCWDRVRYVKRRLRGGLTAGQLLALLLLLLAGRPIPRWPEPRPAPSGGRRVGVGVNTGNRYVLHPSYRRLVTDLGRPAAAPEAADVLRRKIPEEALPWLDDVLQRQDLAALKVLTPPGKSDDRVELDMLRAMFVWLREQEEDPDGDGDDEGPPPSRPKPPRRSREPGVNHARP